MSFLNDLPVASLTFIAGTVLVIVATLTGELGITEALKDIGYVGVGSGAIGFARNGAGRGVR